MSLKLKALLQLIGLIVAGGAFGAAMSFILKNLTPEQILSGIQAAIMAGLFYTIYTLLLTRLEIKESKDKLNK